MAMFKCVVFRLGREEFGINIRKIVEIIKFQESYALPELPNYISGVITVRGDVIPLVDMRKRLKIKGEPGNERILLVRVRGEKVGLLVDEVTEISGFEEHEIMPPPSIFKGLKTEYLHGIGKKEGRVIILLAIDKVLTAEELLMLKASVEASGPEGESEQ